MFYFIKEGFLEMLKNIVKNKNTTIYTVGEDKKITLSKKDISYKTNEKFFRLEFMRDFSVFRDIDVISKDHKVVMNFKIYDSKKEVYIVFLMNELKKVNIKLLSDLLKDESFKYQFIDKIKEESGREDIFPLMEDLMTQN